MGTPLFAVPVLEYLNNSTHKILEVYTQPPKKKNRGQKISFSPVHKYSNKKEKCHLNQQLQQNIKDKAKTKTKTNGNKTWQTKRKSKQNKSNIEAKQNKTKIKQQIN